MPASHTLTRVLTAAVLVPVVLAIMFFAPLWLLSVVIALIIVLALREFFELAAKAGMAGYPGVGIAISIFLVFEQWLAVMNSGYGSYATLQSRSPEFPDLGGSLVGFVLILALWSIATHGSLRDRFAAIASTSFGVLAIGLPLSFLVPLSGSNANLLFRLQHDLFGPTPTSAYALSPPPWLLLFTLLVVWVGDTVAYFVGRLLGRHKLAPEISPGKTWEGAIGNLVGAMLVAFMFSRNSVHLTGFFVAAAVGSVAGQVGDLTESMYKRAAGVKDSGTLLPGHGGVLDRIDALIFAAPAVWAYFTYVVR